MRLLFFLMKLLDCSARKYVRLVDFLFTHFYEAACRDIEKFLGVTGSVSSLLHNKISLVPVPSK